MALAYTQISPLSSSKILESTSDGSKRGSSKVFFRHPHHQPLGFLVNSGTTPGFAKLRSVELGGDELSVPGQQRIRFRDRRQFCQGFPSQPVGDLRQRSFFAIG